MGERIINIISGIGFGLLEIVVIVIIAMGYSVLTKYAKQMKGTKKAPIPRVEIENSIRDKEDSAIIENKVTEICKAEDTNKLETAITIDRQHGVPQNNSIKYDEEKELKWAIEQERKENRKFVFYSEPIKYIGKCNFLHGDYCEKYDYTPADCSQGCTWRERRLPDYKINYNEEVSSDDIQNEKHLSLFGEFYYDYEAFNKENYEDIQDYIQFIVEHDK